jgi:DHA1 family bicyclomycin/chloramphenicol resistance-like MFS transporter
VLPAVAFAGIILVVNAYTGFGGFAGILAPLFVCVASVGFVLPNTTVLAMQSHGRIAGSSSALLGALQFLLGAAAGSLTGVFANGTPMPLALVMAVCASRVPPRLNLRATGMCSRRSMCCARISASRTCSVKC